MTQEDTTTEEETSQEEESTDETSEETSTETESTDEETETKDLAAAKKLRSENRRLRERAKAAEDRAEKLENEKLSDSERASKEATDARERANALEARVKRAEIAEAAAGKEIANPTLAAELIDPSKVELDDDGKATNADELIAELLVRFPDLKAKAKDETRPDNLEQVLKDGSRVNKDADKPQLTADQVKAMSPEQIEEARANGQLRDYLASS